TGAGIHFDGSSYVQAVDDPALNPAGPFTLTAWIRSDGSRARSGLISKYQHKADDLPSERSYALKLYYGAFEFLVSADGTARGLRTIRGATQIPMHQWTHVAAVFEPGKYMRLYVNGKLDGHATERIPSQPAPFPVPLWLGATYRLTDEESFFKGSLDEIRIYKRTLTSAEIQTLASQGE
ncbi:MAG: LamG domain-containing protein, partial [Verrucomicrobiaceae bacterium]